MAELADMEGSDNITNLRHVRTSADKRAAEEIASLEDHCTRAIMHGLRVGEHGLPLMGSGDWNDGMNLVGELGKGESVWLAWFLVDVWKKFAAVCADRGELELAARYRDSAVRLAATVERTSWDGEWYRRAYFDDGTPLGSARNDECRIDSISQSWSVLSGAVSYTHLRAHETVLDLVCRLLLEKKIMNK
mgnify:CR=1 FL=1